jgi:hypothetical protein
LSKGDHFRFSSVFIKKKVTKPKKTETSSNRPVSVRFGYFRTKIGSARFFRFFSVWLGFFLVWVRFGSVRFFQFQAYKIETELVSFLLIDFFFIVRFFQFCFQFSRFNRFFDFFTHPLSKFFLPSILLPSINTKSPKI